MSNVNAVIRAVDVGYGNTKYIRDVVDGRAVADHFPSIVNRPSVSKASFQESPDIYQVMTNRNRYEVSLGINAAGREHIMHENCIKTDDFMASSRTGNLLENASYYYGICAI